jgi:hypothetical protein
MFKVYGFRRGLVKQGLSQLVVGYGVKSGEGVAKVFGKFRRICELYYDPWPWTNFFENTQVSEWSTPTKWNPPYRVIAHNGME